MSEIKLPATSSLQPAINNVGGLTVGKMHRILGMAGSYKSGFGLDLMLELAFNNPRDADEKTTVLYFTAEMSPEVIYRHAYARLRYREHYPITNREMQDEDIGNVISYVNMILSDIGWELAAITVNPSVDVDRLIDIVQQTSTSGGQDILFLDDMVLDWSIRNMRNKDDDWDPNRVMENRRAAEARLMEVMVVGDIVSICAHNLPPRGMGARFQLEDHIDRLARDGDGGVAFFLEWTDARRTQPYRNLQVTIATDPVSRFRVRVGLDPMTGALLNPMVVSGVMSLSSEVFEREYSNCWVGSKSIQQPGAGSETTSDSSDSNDPTKT